MSEQADDQLSSEQAENRTGKRTRFQKGQSGNPGGRPRNTLLKRVRELLTPEELDAAAKAYIKQLKAGSFKHARELIERDEGRVPQMIELQPPIQKEPFDWEAYRRRKAVEAAQGNGGRFTEGN